MENQKQKILQIIGKVYEKAKGCKLEDKIFSELEKELTELSAYFGTSPTQAFFVAVAFGLNYQGESIDPKHLTNYLKCNIINLLEHNNDFETLFDKGIFIKKKSKHKHFLSGNNDKFTINEKIIEAVLQNRPIPKIKQNKIQDVYGILEELYNLGTDRLDGDISTFILFFKATLLISENQHFTLIKKISDFNYRVEDTYLYIYLIWKTLTGEKATELNRAMEVIFDTPSARFQYMQQILNNDNVLIQNDLVEVIEGGFFDETRIKLTYKSLKMLNNSNITLYFNIKPENILSPAKIPYRKLIFNEQQMQELFMLKDLLTEQKLQEVRRRLRNKNLPQGITALLYGLPGTGKTEFVKQIAKETGRELMKVDISQSKSMWFGESEKIIKRIFTDYKNFAKESERLPILFFNEADAIISKRKDIRKSSVAQTENAIQSIILDELENFDGILLATSNLVENFDTAFERRFLFKIEFQKPAANIRAKIWKLKFPLLTDEQCNLLAEKFDISGGHIDNIFRKKEIYEIVHNKKIEFDDLLKLATDEILYTNKKQIGFNQMLN